MHKAYEDGYEIGFRAAIALVGEVSNFTMGELASAIEARRAETHSGSVEDESAVAKPDAQERSA